MSTSNKVALITGITGQDGSYLAEILIEKGYDVHGIVRRTSLFNRTRIEGAQSAARKAGRIYELHYGDVAEYSGLNRIISLVKPSEVYNLAGQSHVRVSFDEPGTTADLNGTAVLRILDSLRSVRPDARFYQASTSELYGWAKTGPITEESPFHPRTPYGVSKLFGYWITRNYREAYGMHASNGILFNHESPRRGENFVTRKITLTLAKIRRGEDTTLRMGNIDARRDWGYAGDYAEMMWLMLQQPDADDYVAATGEQHTVREFICRAAEFCGWDIVWDGEGVDEKGFDRKTGKLLVEIDPRFFRPAEVELPLCNPEKAWKKLGWKAKVKFDGLVEMMMKADLKEQLG